MTDASSGRFVLGIGASSDRMVEGWNQIPFRKPLSCHMYPIRVVKLADHDGLNYHKWPICKPACACGAKLDVPVYRFLKDALVRAYGQEWFDELDNIHTAWVEERSTKIK